MVYLLTSDQDVSAGKWTVASNATAIKNSSDLVSFQLNKLSTGRQVDIRSAPLEIHTHCPRSRPVFIRPVLTAGLDGRPCLRPDFIRLVSTRQPAVNMHRERRLRERCRQRERSFSESDYTVVALYVLISSQLFGPISLALSAGKATLLYLDLKL